MKLHDFEFPPGEYYIGDLCYVVSNESIWDKMAAQRFVSNYTRDDVNGVFRLSTGWTWAEFCTAYGDGCYVDNEGRAYSVDSGGIGCISKDKCADKYNHITDLGHFFTFDKPFKVWCDGEGPDLFGEATVKGGILHFGNITIDTYGEEEE